MEDLYCSTCKDYTSHDEFVCQKCGDIHNPDLKRYIICGASDHPDVLAAKEKLLEKDPDVIIIDEAVALKHKTGIPVFDKDPTYLRTYDFDMMKGYEDFKYSHLSKKEREANIEPVRTEPKIGRNDPCPCGSGLKYKKCCITKNK